MLRLTLPVTLLLVFPLSVSNAEVRDAGAIEALETWMAEKKYPDHNLELHDFGDDYGFGLRATAPIKKGAVMLRVPEAALMYPASALRSPLAMPLKTRRIDAESVMALHFLYEYNSKKSAWKPWMALQPTAPVLLAMLKDHELGPLDGAPSQGILRGYLQFVGSAYSQVSSISDKYPKLFKKEAFSHDKFQWAMAMVLGRAFVTSVQGQGCFAFAPFADFFNHKPTIDTRIQWRKDHLEFIAGENYATGDQVFLNWAHKRNAEMAMFHGLVVPNNTLDWFPIQLTPKSGSDLGENDQKIDMLKERGLWKDQYELREDNFTEVLMVMRIFYMDQKEWDAKAYEKAILGKRVSKMNEMDTLTALSSAIRDIIGQYPHTTKADEQQLKKETDKLQRLFLKIRLEDKRLLRSVLDQIMAERKSLSSVMGSVVIGDDPDYADVLYSDEDKEFHGVKDSKMPIRHTDEEGNSQTKPGKQEEEEEEGGKPEPEPEPEPAGPVKVKFGRKSDKKPGKATAAKVSSKDASQTDKESKQRKGRRGAPEPEL